MKIKFFCPLWGSEHLPFRNFLENVKASGYHGVEMSFPLDEKETLTLVQAIKEFDLEVIAQHWETIDRNFDSHKRNFEGRLRNLAGVSPLFINSQTGKDYYSVKQNSELITLAEVISKETGVTIIHETHRGKFAFAAHVMEHYLPTFPNLKLCLDISHWCCVAETLLHDQHDAVEAAISRTHHIHARVGHTQGAQIMDPRAPEHRDTLDQHVAWWQHIVDMRKQDGYDLLTITTEFGAPPYLPLFPYTGQPVYSQWDVNVFMMHHLENNLHVSSEFPFSN